MGIGLAEVAATINSDLGTPLNHIMWLNDYNLFGERSYVFQKKNILHELYKDYKLVMNDSRIRQEVFDYVIEKGFHVGECLSALEGVEGTPEEWGAFDSIYKLMSQPNIVEYCENDSRIMDLINGNDAANSAYITATDQSEVYSELIASTSLSMDDFPTVASILDSEDGVAAIMADDAVMIQSVENELIGPLVFNVYGKLAYAIGQDVDTLDLFLHSAIAIGYVPNSAYGHMISQSPYIQDIATRYENATGTSYDGMAILTGYSLIPGSTSAITKAGATTEYGYSEYNTTLYAFTRNGITYSPINDETVSIEMAAGATGFKTTHPDVYGGTLEQPYKNETFAVNTIVANASSVTGSCTYSIAQYQQLWNGWINGVAALTLTASEKKSITAKVDGTVSYIPLPLTA